MLSDNFENFLDKLRKKKELMLENEIKYIQMEIRYDKVIIMDVSSNRSMHDEEVRALE